MRECKVLQSVSGHVVRNCVWILTRGIAMNVIRMIKLFGWEKKVTSQVQEKREEELVWYRKRQFLGLINSNIK
jgi:hypothetical protein